MEASEHLVRLSIDIEAFALCLEVGPLGAPIVGCPDWTLGDLGHHLGSVHRWARHAVLHSEPLTEAEMEPSPSESDALAGWLRAGGERLLDALRNIDPNAPTWHPFPVPKVASVWPRRQAQEASVHRWDAEYAVNGEASIDASFAADGIDEYFSVMLPRLAQRQGLAAPASVFEVRATDTGEHWVVDGRSGVVLVADHVEPQAALAGPAESVLLRLWGRPIDPGAVQVDGDADVASAWLAMGGA